jgi:hypothetical protein
MPKKHNANVIINSNHVKVSKDGVTTGFHSPGRKTVLCAGVRKQKIDAFKAMGIKRTDGPVRRRHTLAGFRVPFLLDYTHASL